MSASSFSGFPADARILGLDIGSISVDVVLLDGLGTPLYSRYVRHHGQPDKVLCAELEALGYEFVTNGDTETIVRGYEAWGTDVFEKLRGMFAIAIWDAPKKRLVCARDLFGIKPFYYQHDGNRLIYGSEIKAFLAHPAFVKELNREMLPQYLCFEYMNDSQTMFKDVHKLLPGHFMVFEDGALNIECFYHITYKIDESKSLDEWADEINRVFDESVAAHEIADVEIGSFLSGGIDSSLAAYCMGQHAPDIKTFSVGYDIGCEDKLAEIDALPDFDIKLNELDDATAFAEWAKLPNWQVKVDAQEFLDIVPTEQYHMDEPLGAPSAIPLFFVSKLAREQVKVVQSGEGADELFGGYWIYHDQFEFDKYFKVPRPLRAAAGAVAEKLPPFHGRRFAMRGSGGPEKSYQRASMNYMWDEIPNVLKDYAGPCKPWEWCKPHFDEAAKQDLDIITQTQYVDMVSYMPFDICLKADKMSMSQSLELRVPFLDKEFLDVAMRINPEAKMAKNGRIEKWILRKAFEELLPEEIVWRQKEQFSDGVGYGWIDTLKRITSEAVSDREMEHAAERFPINPPRNKEEYYYRTIFEEHFPSQTAAQCVPSVPSVACSTAEALAWDAAFRDRNDPSGRAVLGVHNTDLTHG